MNLVFDIFQGIGVAAAVGVRPFLPALAVGALGAGDIQIDFAHCDMSWLQKPPFLLAMAVCAIALALVERRLSTEQLERAPFALVLAAASIVIGALLFAGSLCRGGYAIWPGLVGGAICALVGVLATRPLLARARARLEDEQARLAPVFTEGAALLAAVLSVVAPPVGVVVLGLLLWLLIAGRGRDDQKYAGLRILR
ncbi:MAG: DUF4126 family protein [Solirubrobacteraceae bacterium]